MPSLMSHDQVCSIFQKSVIFASVKPCFGRIIAVLRPAANNGFGILFCCGEEFGSVAQAVLAVCIDLQDVGITVFLRVFQTGFDRCALAAVDSAVKDINAV